tara:strand:- start:102 stop:371 length:270 start_codon:yes stop_codon:yes gene_type:complete
MIDIDKYEGHTEGEWKWYEGARHKSLTGSMRLLMFAEDGNNEHPKPADARLLADAPLLLAFYKRIKEIMDIDEIQEIERVELILQEMIE